MIEELLLSANPYGCRAAAISEGRPVAFFVESASRPSRVGDIHLAQVRRAMPGIDASFVELGDGTTAFVRRPPRGRETALIVQIVADAHREKAPRASTDIALAGRFVIYRPAASGSAVSRRVAGHAGAKARLDALRSLDLTEGGFTLRRAALDVDTEPILLEARRLAARWCAVREAAAEGAAPRRLLSAGGLFARLARDIVQPNRTRLVVEPPTTMESLALGGDGDRPDLDGIVRAHDGHGALFDRYDCAGRFAAALEPEVLLPSGGRLIIEECRALTAIDVDSASQAPQGGRGADLRRVREEAIGAVADATRLRNLSGLIVIDLPGQGASAREVQALGRALAADRTPCRVLGATDGGLLEFRRQRVGESLLDALTEPVPGTHGGRRARLDSAAFEAAQAAAAAIRSGARAVTLRAGPPMIARLTAPGEGALAGWLGASVDYETDRSMARGHVEVVAT